MKLTVGYNSLHVSPETAKSLGEGLQQRMTKHPRLGKTKMTVELVPESNLSVATAAVIKLVRKAGSHRITPRHVADILGKTASGICQTNQLRQLALLVEVQFGTEQSTWTRAEA